MAGPRIIGFAPEQRPPRKTVRETGIQQDSSGNWVAIRNGRLVRAFSGPGARRLAMREAGTNTVIG